MFSDAPLKSVAEFDSRTCRRLSLRELLVRIVRQSDSVALGEFHSNRTIFSHQDDAFLLFTEFLSRLRRAAAEAGWGGHIERAYDLVVDKFSRLPSGELGENRIDCRNYFSAALKIIADRQPTSQLREDGMLAEILQRLVCRQFELSLRESKRNGFMTRYCWNLPRGTLTVLMPRTMSGSDRAKWLRANVPNPDPSQAGERDRIQTIIDQHLAKPSDRSCAIDLCPSDLPWASIGAITVCGLAETLATEKADRILEQRLTIRKLGPLRLKELIHRIFDVLSEGNPGDAKIAREFHLSSATFSRFAGSHWTGPDRQGIVPDLWRNLARLLASHDDFIAAAKQAGVWNRVVRLNAT